MPSAYLIRRHHFDDNHMEWVDTLSDEDPVFTMPSAAEERVEKLNQIELKFHYSLYIDDVERRNRENEFLRSVRKTAEETGNADLIAAIGPAPAEEPVLSIEDYQHNTNMFEKARADFYTVAEMELV